MLILSRKIGQEIRIAKDIVVVVKRIRGDRVSIGIEAPSMNKILRGELSAKVAPTDASRAQIESRQV